MNRLRAFGTSAALALAAGCGPEGAATAPMPTPETTSSVSTEAYAPNASSNPVHPCTPEQADDPDYRKRVAEYCAQTLQGNIAVVNLWTDDKDAFQATIDMAHKITSKTTEGRISLNPIIMTPPKGVIAPLVQHPDGKAACIDLGKGLLAKQLAHVMPGIDDYPLILTVTENQPCGEKPPQGLASTKYADVYGNVISPGTAGSPDYETTMSVAKVVAHEELHFGGIGHDGTVKCGEEPGSFVDTEGQTLDTAMLTSKNCDYDIYGDASNTPDIIDAADDSLQNIQPNTLAITRLEEVTSADGSSALAQPVTAEWSSITLEQAKSHVHATIRGSISVKDIDPTGTAGEAPITYTFEGLRVIPKVVDNNSRIEGADIYLSRSPDNALIGSLNNPSSTIIHDGQSYELVIQEDKLLIRKSA